MDLKSRSLNFLYKWVQEKKIPHIRTGMVEDMEGFVVTLVADIEAYYVGEKMKAKATENEKAKEKKNEEDN